MPLRHIYLLALNVVNVSQGKGAVHCFDRFDSMFNCLSLGDRLVERVPPFRAESCPGGVGSGPAPLLCVIPFLSPLPFLSLCAVAVK